MGNQRRHNHIQAREPLTPMTRSKTTALVLPETARLGELLDAIEPHWPVAHELPAAPQTAATAAIAGDDRLACKRFIDTFGPQGGVWFSEGKTFDECQALSHAALQKESEQLAERLRQAGVER